MKRDFLWFAAVLFALFIGTGTGTRDRYQATIVEDKVFVLDKTSGEMWVSAPEYDEYGRITKALAPMEYTKNSRQWSMDRYTPEETRSDKNAEWSTWVQRKISPPSKKTG